MSFNLVDVCLFSKEINNVIHTQNRLKNYSSTLGVRDCGSGSSTGLNIIIPPRQDCGTVGAVVLLVSV